MVMMRLPGEHNGELAWLYLAASPTLLFAGAGKFSMDHGLSSHGSEKYREARPSTRKFKAAAR